MQHPRRAAPTSAPRLRCSHRRRAWPCDGPHNDNRVGPFPAAGASRPGLLVDGPRHPARCADKHAEGRLMANRAAGRARVGAPRCIELRKASGAAQRCGGLMERRRSLPLTQRPSLAFRLEVIGSSSADRSQGAFVLRHRLAGRSLVGQLVGQVGRDCSPGVFRAKVATGHVGDGRSVSSAL
jgi:hypothetical protein